MKREFVRLLEFDKQCKRIGLSEDDIFKIEIKLLIDPACGDMIQGTGGIRKIRVAINNSGKSGGARVAYVDFSSYEKTYFLTVFAKGETDNFSQAEKRELKLLVSALKNELRKKDKR